MKGTIVEIRGNKAAALTQDGTVKLVPNQNYSLGQVIVVKTNNIVKFAAAAAAVFAVCVISASAYAMPYSTMSLDVNPSIELSLNRFDRVLGVTAVNDDGEKILTEIKLKNMKVDNAVQLAVQAIIQNGYISQEQGGGVVIAASSKNDEYAVRLASRVQNEVCKTVDEALGEDNKVEVVDFALGKDRVEYAHELGLTPGKLHLIEKLAEEAGEELDEDFVEKWSDASVKTIMRANKLSSVELSKLVKEIEKLGKEILKTESGSIDNKILGGLLDELYGRFEDEKDEIEESVKPNKPDNQGQNGNAEKDKGKPVQENNAKPEKPDNSNKDKDNSNGKDKQKEKSSKSK